MRNRVKLFQRITPWPLTFANLLLDVLVEVQPNYTSQLQTFVRRKTRSPKRIPGQHLPFGQSIQMMLPFNGRQLLHSPLLHLPTSGFESIFRPDHIRVELLGQTSLAGIRLRAGCTASERPSFGKHLQGRSKASEIQIDPAEAISPHKERASSPGSRVSRLAESAFSVECGNADGAQGGIYKSFRGRILSFPEPHARARSASGSYRRRTAFPAGE